MRASVASARAHPAHVVSAQVFGLDAMLRRLAAARDRSVLPLARAARAFHEAQGWIPLGFAQLQDWSREHLDRSGRWLRQLAGLDRAVEAHPPLRAALTGDDGGQPLGICAILEIARVCHRPPPGAPDDKDRVAAWIARARSLSLAELRCLARMAGAAPADVGMADADLGADSGMHHVTLGVPPDVQAAFEETFDLHRAVAGHESGIGDFIEALCAEAASGAFASALSEPASPRDVPVTPVRSAARPRPRATAWHAQGSASLDSTALRRAATTLQQLSVAERDVAAFAGTEPCGRHAATSRSSRACPGTRALAKCLAELVACQDRIEVHLGELLSELDATRPWQHSPWSGGLDPLACYAEERLRLSRTTARDRVHAARRLPRLPIVRAAYESGTLGLEKTLLLLRVDSLQGMDASTQTRWVEHASRTTLKRLRDEYRALRRQQSLRASDPAGEPRDRLPLHPLDDATWLASIGRRPGRARSFVLETGCRILARTQEERWSPVVFLQARLPEEQARDFAAAVDTARRLLWEQAAGQASGRGLSAAAKARSRPSTRIAQVCRHRPTGVPAWLGLLALLEEYVLTWDAPQAIRRGRWDAIHARSGWRCTCAGCTRRSGLEAHHVRYRSRGGGNEPENLLSVCGLHHRLGEHGTMASCRGEAPLGIVWGLGESGNREWYRNERRIGPPRQRTAGCPGGASPAAQVLESRA